MPPVVVGQPVDEENTGVRYVSASAGAEVSYLLRSDGSVDRIRSAMGGFTKSRVCQRLRPPEKTTYVAASAGVHASYLLRADGAVDRVQGGDEASVKDTITPEDYPKVTYTACSNSQGPCYLLRSDGKVDMYRISKDRETLEGPYEFLSGGTEDSYHLKADGSVDRIYAYGKIGSTTPSPENTKYIAVGTQCIMHQNQYGAGHLYAIYFVRADGKVDRISGPTGATTVITMEPPEGLTYLAVSSLDQASYLLRSDGAVDRTTGFGKVSNTMNPPPGHQYVHISAGQYASYFVRSDGKVDRTEGSGRVKKTIAPDMDPEEGCAIM